MSNGCNKGSCGDGKDSAKGGTCAGAKASVAMQDLAIQGALNKIKYKILVMSGKGGVGKSTVATNLAMGLANKGHRVGLMDVDLHGPDICRMLGLTNQLRSEAKINQGQVPPMVYNDNLKVISLEYMMENRDEAIIWRGPLKVQAIRQFIADINWGELDYLVIDAPPGTGDEPLSVAQIIKDVNALIVTTPQEVALADVRKSINFCKLLKMQVVGVVENMSGFICPHCKKSVDIFKSGGGQKIALEHTLPFLGKIPMDPQVVLGGDDGKPFLASSADSPATKAFADVVAKVEKSLPAIPVGTSTKDGLPMADCACGCGSDSTSEPTSGCDC